MEKTEAQMIEEDARFEECLKQANAIDFTSITVLTFGNENKRFESLKDFYLYAKDGDYNNAEITGDYIYNNEPSSVIIPLTKAYYNYKWSEPIEKTIMQGLRDAVAYAICNQTAS